MEWQKDPPGEGWFFWRDPNYIPGKPIPKKISMVHCKCETCGHAEKRLCVVSESDEDGYPRLDDYGGEWWPEPLPRPPE